MHRPGLPGGAAWNNLRPASVTHAEAHAEKPGKNSCQKWNNKTMTAPIPENEAQRLQWLRQCAILDTLPETMFDEAAQLAAALCRVPTAAINLIDADRQWSKAAVGQDKTQDPRAFSFCAHAILQPDLLVVPDARRDARFARNPLVTGEPHIRFYAGAPLITTEGFGLGSLCVIDRVPRRLTDARPPFCGCWPGRSPGGSR